ncbi:MAG: (2Fe-2S)-binding protein [Afipia sp.]
MTVKPITIAFSLNANPVEVSVPVNTLLIDLVRDHLGFKGTKRSCDMEVCGACTMLLDGEPISSCTTLAVDVDGRNLTTIEGVTPANGLSPLQEAFVLYGAIQCGFCTPGFILAVTELLNRNPNPTDDEIRHHLHGNLCRCTGYAKIFAAVKSVVRDEKKLNVA